MPENKFIIRWNLIALIIFATAFSRLLPHVFGITEYFNFSPLGAIALFGAAYFIKKESSFLLPLVALWSSNLLLDNIFFPQYYDGFALFENWEVYLTLVLIVLLGLVMLKKVTGLRVLFASLSASVLFFFVTNFFVWAEGVLYPQTVEGLLTCYVAAIPFFWNTLAGDLFFSALLFGGFEWALSTFPSLKASRA